MRFRWSSKAAPQTERSVLEFSDGHFAFASPLLPAHPSNGCAMTQASSFVRNVQDSHRKHRLGDYRAGHGSANLSALRAHACRCEGPRSQRLGHSPPGSKSVSRRRDSAAPTLRSTEVIPPPDVGGQEPSRAHSDSNGSRSRPRSGSPAGSLSLRSTATQVCRSGSQMVEKSGLKIQSASLVLVMPMQTPWASFQIHLL